MSRSSAAEQQWIRYVTVNCTNEHQYVQESTDRCSQYTSCSENRVIRTESTEYCSTDGGNTTSTGSVSNIDGQNTVNTGSMSSTEPRVQEVFTVQKSEVLVHSQCELYSIPIYCEYSRYEQYRTPTYCQCSQYLPCFPPTIRLFTPNLTPRSICVFLRKIARACSVWYRYSRYLYGCRTQRTEVNLPKCKVAVLMS